MSSKAFRACRCRDLSTSLSALMRFLSWRSLSSYTYLLLNEGRVCAYLIRLRLYNLEVYKIRRRNGIIDVHDEVLDLNEEFTYMFI